MRSQHPGRRWLAAQAVGLALVAATAAHAQPPRIYAIEGAHVIAAPGRSLEVATIVLRDGLIESVGSDAAVPPDARVIDGEGLWVWAGLVDADPRLELDGGDRTPRGDAQPGRSEASRTPPGPVHPLARIRPEARTRDTLVPFAGDGKREMERHRELGVTTVLAAPRSGILRGRSVALHLAEDRPVAELILRDDVAQHVAFERGRFGQGYPTSLMGSVAAVRQALLDARRHGVWTARYEARPLGMQRPARHAAWEALAPVLASAQPVLFHVDDPQDALLADRLAREFGLDAVIRASGHEWEIASGIAAAGRPLLLPIAFPDEPEVDEDDDALDVDIRTMRRFLEAPATPAVLHRAGVRFALVTGGLKSSSDFRKNLHRIVEAGLPTEVALAALTTVPAELLGIARIVGTIEPGKIADLVVADGPPFGEKTKVRRVFVDGVDHELEVKDKPVGDPDAVVDPRGVWSVVLDFGSRSVERSWTIRGERDAYTGVAETGGGDVDFESVELVGNALTVTYPARGRMPAMEVTVIVKGDTFEGSAEMGPRTVTVRGDRTAGPEAGR